MSRRFFIDEGSFPNIQGMMLATLDALRAIGGSANIQELDEKVVEIEGVPEKEQSITMSENDPRSRLNYYLAWARTYLRRGDAIINSSRGVWAITEKGSKITSILEIQRIYDQVQSEERERIKRKKLADSLKIDADQSQSPNNQDQGEKDFEDWKSELLEILKSMDPSAFERLAQRLLRESGFTKVEVRGKSGDGGIDGVGVLRVNLVSFQVYFQCKRYKGSVGSSDIRDFRGAMQGRADKGLFITTGNFTAQASDEATRDGATAIDLIDGDRLCYLLKDNELGVSKKLIEKVTIDSSWFDGI